MVAYGCSSVPGFLLSPSRETWMVHGPGVKPRYQLTPGRGSVLPASPLRASAIFALSRAWLGVLPPSLAGCGAAPSGAAGAAASDSRPAETSAPAHEMHDARRPISSPRPVRKQHDPIGWVLSRWESR